MTAGVLLLILSAYYVNSTLFYHSHQIDGETIFHSHLSFDKNHSSSDADGNTDSGENSESESKHTLQAAKLIAALNNITIEQQEFDSHVDAPERRLEYAIPIYYEIEPLSFLGSCRSLRAPPVLDLV